MGLVAMRLSGACAGMLAAAIAGLAGAILVAANVGAADRGAAPIQRPGAAPDPGLLLRGEYLARAADCTGCHTARVGGRAYAGGLSMSTPFGLIISTNITPDPDHGIGRYSYEDFARALRQGIARDGHNLYPAMPYPSFSSMADDDVRALYAYLMHGVQPVADTPPATRLAFPFNQRWGLTAWRWLYMPKPQPAPMRDDDPIWTRGAYLVRVLGHCGACHTARGLGFQEKAYDESSPDFLSGQVNDDWFAPSLHNSSGSGIGRLGEADLVAFMKTGHAAGTAAYGTMVDTIHNSLQYLTDDDLRAIARYLKTLPPGDDPARYHPDRRTVAERTEAEGNRTLDVQSGGAAVYNGFCARCHQAQGVGVRDVYPALAGNPSVLTKDTTSLMRIVLEGGASPATRSGPPPTEMPGFAQILNDQQVAQVLTYVRTSWGNDADPVSANDVQGLRKILRKR
jgi:mono/diheme cytochrome c family protein